jgi:hypothetical protein
LAVEIFGRLIESHGNLPGAASDCIVDMVGEAFGVKGRKRRRLRANHTVCRILVEIVKALDYIGKQPPRMIGRAVAAAWPSDEPTVAALAGKAAEIVAAAIYKAATGGQLDVIIYDCRVLAIVTCPDMDRHHEVAEVCAGPLLQGKLSEHLKGDLERIVSNYRGTRATAGGATGPVGDYLTELCPGWVGGGDMPGTRPTHLDGRYLAVQPARSRAVKS